MNKFRVFVLRFTFTIVISLFFITGFTQVPYLPPAYSSSVPVNYVRTWDAVKPETNSANILTSAAPTYFRMTTQYVDGLGRPVQTVMKQGSYPTGGTAVDLVSPVVYDEFGREQFRYQPFAANTTGANASVSDGLFKQNPFQQQAAFYNNSFGNSPVANQDETFYYGQTKFEASPLNRPLETFASGNSWMSTSGEATEAARRSVKLKYYTNTTADSVRVWSVTDGSIGTWGTYAASGNFAAGQLFKTVTADEHNKQVIEFKDKEGKVILKKVQIGSSTTDNGSGSGHVGWLCTYYLYDDLDNLRCVIQPAGVEQLLPTNVLSATILDEQCFRYEYDERNRMIMKKVPGAGEVYMVYDGRDRLVLTQDANLRAGSPQKWMYTQYDGLNRAIATGLWNTSQSRATHATAAASSIAYPNLAGETFELLTETYYDDYRWLASHGNPFSATRDGSNDFLFHAASNTVYPYPQALVQSFQTQGLPTGTRVKVLGTAQELYSINYYDDRGRVIQQISNNTTGSIFYTITQYTFTGQMLMRFEFIGNNNTVVTQPHFLLTNYEYDDLGRLLVQKKHVGTYNGIGATPNTIIAQNEYDALGQLKKKKLAPEYNSGGGLESLAYDYDIRGWLLGVNRAYTKDANQANYFGFDLGYDKAQNGIIGNQAYGNAQYNGNIAGMVWKSKGDGEKRKYDFSYDAANRLMKADFTQYNGSLFNTSANVDFSMKMGDGLDPATAYDQNGNIKKMQQWGLKLAGSPQIDNLTYAYQAGSNKLARVTDAISTDNKLGDFKDGSNTGTDDYNYDANGNLTLDHNKSISSITYNHLNLPSVISVTGKGTITYTYDAAGTKLKKVTVDNTVSPARTTTTVYLGPAVYQNDTLQFIGMEEGRIRFKPENTSFVFDYMLKDHLGNVRMVLTEELKTDAYPVASMETAQATTEEAIYGNVSTTRVNKPSGYPTDTYTNPNDKVALVRGDGNKIGPSILLEVMAGDRFNIRANAWWTGTSSGSNTNPLTSIVSALIGSAPGVSGGKIGAGDLTSTLLDPQITTFLGSQPGVSGKPKAYLNWVLFDEQFKLVATNSNAEAVDASGVFKTFNKTNMPVDKNGYLYIYVSNETSYDVFFDNLQVTHVRGSLLEESHYYPFGLTMAGISSKALSFGGPENKYKYNGIEQNDAFDINMYDAFYRNLDPQIGRFWQIDPEAESQESYSPYESMGNNPVSNVDPLGDFKTRFGAWIHRVFNGGGEIQKNKYGEWSVSKSKVEDDGNGGTIVKSWKYYGKGRDQYSATRDAIERDLAVMQDIEENGDASIYQMHDSPEEASNSRLKFGTGVLTPNPILRTGTNVINATQLANKGKKLVQSISRAISVQKQARHLAGTARSGAGFFNNIDDAKKVLDAVHSGEAVFLGVTKAGQPVFRYSGVTGTNVNLGVNIAGQETNIFIIKGTVSPSVVPTNPNWLPFN